MKKVLVIGGKGSLGSAMLKRFKAPNSQWQTFSFDIGSSRTENADVELSPKQGMRWEGIVDWIHSQANEKGRFDAVITAAGGFIPGDIESSFDNFEKNWKMNTRSAYLSAQIAAKNLSKKDSLFLLTGAKAAMESGPDFAIGYGISKAATHHLAKSVSSYLNTVCILPDILDTPTNRSAMPDSDHSSWTKLTEVAEKVFIWAENPNLVKNELFIEV